MLLHLKIRDFAIIDEVDLELGSGFTVVTGETGAGKSILVDALILALGGRASGDVVRNGCDAAEVEALFDISSHPIVQARLEQRELVGDDPATLLVRRVIGVKGRAKVIINGRLSTLATLAEIVRGLVDISGQHEQQSLLFVENHLAILDDFGQLIDKREAYREQFEAWRAAAAELHGLQSRSDRDLQRADFVKFQLDEIERLAPRPGEDEELEVEHKKLAHAQKLKSGAMLAEALLYGEDGSAFDKLGKAAAELESLARIDEELAPVREALAGAQRDLQDAARTLQRYLDRVSDDPERLSEVEDRLNELRRLARKHGGSLADVLARRADLEREILSLDNSDARVAELTALAAEKLVAAERLAADLSKARRKAAAQFDQRVCAEIAEMDLAGAVLATQVSVRPVAGGEGLTASGADDVEFAWGPNRGEPLRPLAKIASGGELSRLMLGVKTVLASRDLVSLYVFDEVDTGLGGRAADAIGKKIQAVARGHQAITITHLAPIAARADVHICVRKESQGERTVATLEKLKGTARAAEIARMIDGSPDSKATRAAAKEMLARAVA
ncbi:MAG: DNA repair protein RecN [Myxococcota bacterium]|nr:DNA repair protein RecN [Myxococcota bacterium]